jgi:EmrB/QacA subfamily drug resistance transporter
MTEQASSTTTNRRWVLGVTSAAGLLVGLDALVVSAAITTVRSDLGASIDQLGWMVNAYTLTFAVLLMPAAALGDRYGRRRVFTTGVLLFTGASCGCALASDPIVLIAARAVQGAGSAAVMPLALALLTSAFPPAERADALGVFAATTGISVPLGPLVGGAVVHGVSWPWIFWLNVPLGLALAVAARLKLNEYGTTTARFDVPGVLLVAVGALGLVWALIRGDGSGWDSPEIIGAFVTGLAGLTAFLWWESRTSAPMLPLDLFRNASFAAGGATIFFLWGSALGSIYFMAQFFQSAQGLNAFSAGLRMIAWGATTVVVPRMVGKLIPAHGARLFVVAGMTLHASSLLLFATAADPDRGYVWLAVPLILSGTGVAMAIPATQSLALSSLPGHQLGAGTGAFSMLRQLGGAAGVAAMIAGFAGRGRYGTPDTFTDGFGAAIVIGALFAAVGALAGGGLLTRILNRGTHRASVAATASRRSDHFAPGAESEGSAT